MTDDEWLACDAPGRMRGELRCRPFRPGCWVRFDRACLARASDLLGPAARNCLARLDATDELRLWDTACRNARLAEAWSEAVLLHNGRRDDPLFPARAAAARSLWGLGEGTLSTSDLVCVAAGRRAGQPGLADAVRAERRVHAGLVRCVFRSTLQSVSCQAEWRTGTVLALAAQVAATGDHAALPILADALQDAGCDDEAVLGHCRTTDPHAKGCWVVGLVLGGGGGRD